jgi:hypothetical protein
MVTNDPGGKAHMQKVPADGLKHLSLPGLDI